MWSFSLFFEKGAAKVSFPSRNNTFYGEKNVFFPIFEAKNIKKIKQIITFLANKNKGPDVNFLFDFSKTM